MDRIRKIIRQDLVIIKQEEEEVRQNLVIGRQED